MTTESERSAEQWLRGAGLPSFVPFRAWTNRLGTRVAPFLVFLLLIDIAFAGIVRVRFEIDKSAAGFTVLYLALAVVLTLAVVGVPVALGTVAARILNRYPAAQLPTTVVLLALCLVGTPVVAAITGPGLDAGAALIMNVTAITLAYLLTWLGIGAVLGNGVRTAVRQVAAIGALTTRALPILMLVVVFAFFSRPLWEVTNSMSPARLVAVGMFFVVLGLLFIVPLSRSEIRALDESITPEDRVRAVRSVGLGALEQRATSAGPPLGRLERANLEAAFVFALGFQVVIFALLTCVFLLVLGALAFPSEVLEEWVGTPAGTLDLFGVQFPFTWALLKTAVFLSCVSSLNFLVSVTTNRGYRSTFYDPLFQQARVALSVRAAYLGGLHPSPSRDPEPRPRARHAAPGGPRDDEPEDGDGGELFGVPEPGVVEPGRGSE